MKRRGFLKGFLGTPAAAAVTKLDAAVPDTEWHPTYYEYGEFAVMWIEVYSETPKQYRVKTYCPENDWEHECEKIAEHDFGEYKSHQFSVMGTPWMLYFPVNELTRFEVYEDNVLIHTDMAVYDPEFISYNGFNEKVVGGFPPVRFGDKLIIGEMK